MLDRGFSSLGESFLVAGNISKSSLRNSSATSVIVVLGAGSTSFLTSGVFTAGISLLKSSSKSMSCDVNSSMFCVAESSTSCLISLSIFHSVFFGASVTLSHDFGASVLDSL